MIYQESSLNPQLSVAENVFLGQEPNRLPGLPLIDWRQVYEQTFSLLNRLNLGINPYALVSSLGVAEQRMVEVAKALCRSADLIVMDEPTASLSPPEVDTLFQLIRTLIAQEGAVVYISHRLEEVNKIGGRATVLRDGRKVTTVPLTDTTPDQLIRLMVGHNLSDKFPKRQTSTGPEVLRAEGLTCYGTFEDISFGLHAGEIVGVTGLMGSGCMSLAQAIFGLTSLDEGDIFMDGRPVIIDSPQEAIALGIGLLTEKRERQGLILDMTTLENITLAALQYTWQDSLLNLEAEQDMAKHYIERLNIEPPSTDFPTRFLSSGMQQKVILSRWLATNSRVLMFNQPTRGIDVSSKIEIYRFMADLAEQGVAIIIASLDLTEILGMCDRVLVLYDGLLVASLRRGEVTAEMVMAYANGGPNS
jgi:ribose transport system ATP-binding protein